MALAGFGCSESALMDSAYILQQAWTVRVRPERGRALSELQSGDDEKYLVETQGGIDVTQKISERQNRPRLMPVPKNEHEAYQLWNSDSEDRPCGFFLCRNWG